MKKITAELGCAHNDFDRQVKNLLNAMAEEIDFLVKQQQKKHQETLQSSLCDICNSKADIVTITISDYTHKYYCEKCLTK